MKKLIIAIIVTLFSTTGFCDAVLTVGVVPDGSGSVTSPSFNWPDNPASEYPAEYPGGANVCYEQFAGHPAEGYRFKSATVGRDGEVHKEFFENPPLLIIGEIVDDISVELIFYFELIPDPVKIIPGIMDKQINANSDNGCFIAATR